MATGMTEGRCVGSLFFAGAAHCGGRRCAKRRRAYPGPAQAPFFAYLASVRRGRSTDGYGLTHETPG